MEQRAHASGNCVIAFGGHATAPELRLRRLYSLLGMQKPSLTPDVTIADVISSFCKHERSQAAASQKDDPSRPEAIRRLAELGLANDPPTGKAKLAGLPS